MRTLYHLWLDPFSRKVRVTMAEKCLEVLLTIESVWEKREKFLELNPAAEVPVLVEEDNTVLSDSDAICEYLEDKYPEPRLMPVDLYEKAEVRRLTGWFDKKFYKEVGELLLIEKIFKQLKGVGEPDSRIIRVAQKNMHFHLKYICYLTDRRHWLAGSSLTLADITAAAHISTIDFMGDIQWRKYEGAANWYARVKSRPSFKDILLEKVPGIAPSDNYKNLDF